MRQHVSNGQRFGRLTAVTQTPRRTSDGCIIWACRCDCGQVVEVSSSKLLSGRKLSCGCLIADTQRERVKDYRERNIREHTSIGLISKMTRRSDNQSGVRGVCRNRRKNKWMAYICLQGKHYHLGYYDKIEDAAKVRREAENRIFGEFLDWFKANF